MRSRRSAIAANRFGLGARPGDAAAIGTDPTDWLLGQVDPPVPTRPDRPASADTIAEITRLRLARQVMRRAAARPRQSADDARSQRPIGGDAIREYARFIRTSYRNQAERRLRRALDTDRPFTERLVLFWSNHFAISADKQPVGAVAFDYANEAIRPHVTGNFLDMLMAVEKHPAMLMYLDNQASIGPRSRVAIAAERNRSRELGLNENLAREILELHTLGVDGGYDQTDVTEFAKVITGWSVGGAIGRFEFGAPGEFLFRELMHEPGDKRVLGQRIRESGIDEGEGVLAMLATHPATARHLATKLARHFVADEPPRSVVDDLAATYLDTGGELAPVYRVLIEAEETWAESLPKFRTPEELVISACRALNHVPGNLQQLDAVLTQLGQRSMSPGSPAGWPDTAAHWDGGEPLLKRIEWAAAIGRMVGDRVDPAALADAVLGPIMSAATRQSIRRAESAAQGLTLLLAAPEFQRR